MWVCSVEKREVVGNQKRLLHTMGDAETCLTVHKAGEGTIRDAQGPKGESKFISPSPPLYHFTKHNE